jgi:uncharacterized protein (DUF58 family)
LPWLNTVWAICGGAIAVAFGVEAIFLYADSRPTMARQLPATMSLGSWHEVQLKFLGNGQRNLTVEVFEDLPDHFESQDMPQMLTVPSEGWVVATWRVKPNRRGPFEFGPAWVRTTGPIGILRRCTRLGTAQETKVYPDFRRVAQYALLSLQDRAAWLGLHKQRRRGEGLEFHQLREYRPGDSLRQIDWKAVSRRRQLISREYQEESSQQLVVLLNCGRRMRAQDGDLSHFDHALNAVLLLAYVGLKYGDSVGLLTFSGQDRWLPPVKGGHAMKTILDQIYDLQTTTAPTDYAEAARRLAARQRRRAMVVIVSNLGDEDHDELPKAVALLRRRHLVVHASLRERVLDQVLEAPVSDLASALRLASTHSLLEARRQAHDAIRTHGVQAIDVLPSELPAALVNQYMAIKRAGIL